MEYKGNDFYCDVALKDTASLKKEYESENVLAYHHTRPYWPVHIVVVPKKHIPSFTDRSVEDDGIIAELLHVVRTIAKKVEEEVLLLKNQLSYFNQRIRKEYLKF